MKYRKKPVVIDAVQWTGDNLNEVLSFVAEKKGTISKGSEGNLFVVTLEGMMMTSEGDWIIRGVKGEYYPIKNEIFQETYELVNAA